MTFSKSVCPFVSVSSKYIIQQLDFKQKKQVEYGI